MPPPSKTSTNATDPYVDDEPAPDVREAAFHPVAGSSYGQSRMTRGAPFESVPASPWPQVLLARTR